MSLSTPLEGICSWCGSVMPIEEVNAKPCDACFAKWPKCAVPACQNKSCLRLNSIYCWPHMPGTSSEAADSLEEEDDMLAEDESEDTNVEDSYAR